MDAVLSRFEGGAVHPGLLDASIMAGQASCSVELRIVLGVGAFGGESLPAIGLVGRYDHLSAEKVRRRTACAVMGRMASHTAAAADAVASQSIELSIELHREQQYECEGEGLHRANVSPTGIRMKFGGTRDRAHAYSRACTRRDVQVHALMEADNMYIGSMQG
jgi:hypothetical protein